MMTLRNVRVLAAQIVEYECNVVACLSQGCWCSDKQQGLSHQIHGKEDPGGDGCGKRVETALYRENSSRAKNGLPKQQSRRSRYQCWRPIPCMEVRECCV